MALQHSTQSVRGSDISSQFWHQDTKFYGWLFAFGNHTPQFSFVLMLLSQRSQKTQYSNSRAHIPRYCVEWSFVTIAALTPRNMQRRSQCKPEQFMRSYPGVAEGPLRLHTTPATINVPRRKKRHDILSRSGICFIKHIPIYSGRGPTQHVLSILFNHTQKVTSTLSNELKHHKLVVNCSELSARKLPQKSCLGLFGLVFLKVTS